MASYFHVPVHNKESLQISATLKISNQVPKTSKKTLIRENKESRDTIIQSSYNTIIKNNSCHAFHHSYIVIKMRVTVYTYWHDYYRYLKINVC